MMQWTRVDTMLFWWHLINSSDHSFFLDKSSIPDQVSQIKHLQQNQAQQRELIQDIQQGS
jgi:hypothetical protein